MQYQSVRPEDYPPVRQFLSDLGWQKRVADPDTFRQMMERADRTVVAWDGGRVVGFGRALCDGVSNGYVSLLAVAPDRRGQGVGTEIVRRLMGSEPDITWVVRAGRGSSGFWARQGFTVSEVAMERQRGGAG